MSRFLDTSVIVRYLTGVPPEMAARAAEIVDGEPELLITDVVLTETSYVLRSRYGVPWDEVIDLLTALVGKQNIDTYGVEKPTVLDALLLCRPSRRVSISDAMIWAAARCAGSATVYSFDRRFPSEGITVSR